MSGWRALAFLAAAVVALSAAAPATAAPREMPLRYGPIRLGAYEVKRGDEVFNIPTPRVDGFITKMRARLVYASGREVPIANTMLHHVVMLDLGRYVGDHRDPTCNAFRKFDSQTFLPLYGHRFYGLGEERHRLLLPDGYGYPTRAADKWAMTYMLMNHLPRAETVYIEYTPTVETEQALKPVIPVWLDVRDCNLDPVYDIPGGGRPGSTTTRSTTWTAPTDGHIVAATGHLHGGGLALRISKPACGGQTLFTSRPLWGLPSHPYYRVRPLLHEPGPISMSTLLSGQGIPVAAGETIRLDSTYDASRPHTRVMGIMLAAFAPSSTPVPACAPLPGDIQTFWTQPRGRRKAPRITVPITGYPLRAGARARPIARPEGPAVVARSGTTIDVRRYGFAPANLVVRRGSVVHWRFFDPTLHNVTFANGPRAFSSDNLDGGRAFTHRFTTRGTYRLMCTLHPVGMNETIVVR